MRRNIPNWLKENKSPINVVYIIKKVIQKDSDEEKLNFLIDVVRLLKIVMAKLRKNEF